MKTVILYNDTDSLINEDIFHIYNILNKSHKCFVYSDYSDNNNLASIDRNELSAVVSEKTNLIIYYHSNYWIEGEELLAGAKSKIIFKYHNFFSDQLFIEQTLRLNNNHKEALWLTYSLYVSKNKELINFNNKAALAPFNNIENWSKVRPDNLILKNLIENRNINLLSAGIFAKKNYQYLEIVNMIEIVKNYLDNYGNNIFLNIINADENCLSAELNDLIHYYKLNGKINFPGKLNKNALLSYYLGSDFFLFLNNCESFYLPLIEAQYLHLPVITKKSNVINEILGENQLLLSNDIREYSAAIKNLTDNEKYKEFLIKHGINNYEIKFINSRIEDEFTKIIEEFTGMQV